MTNVIAGGIVFLLGIGVLSTGMLSNASPPGTSRRWGRVTVGYADAA